MSSRLFYDLLGFILPYRVMRLLFPSAWAKEQQASVSPSFEIVTSLSSSEVKSTAAARRYVLGQHRLSFSDQLQLLEQTCRENKEVEKEKAVLLPSVEQLEWDRRKLHTALEGLVKQAGKNKTTNVFVEEKYSISFSDFSLCSPGFVEWVLETFIQYPRMTENLVIEIPESALLHSEEKIQRLAKGLQWVGAHLCITLSSGCAHRFSAFSYLPLYAVKLDASYALDLQKNKSSLEWIQSLQSILFSQGILLVMDQPEIKESSLKPLPFSTFVEL